MTFRTSPLALVTGLALLLAGCGGDSGTVKPVSSGAATDSPTVAPRTAPIGPADVQGTAPPSGSSTATGTGTSPSEPIRVPATFIFARPGRVHPSTVTIPAFIPVQLTLASRDGRAHALALRAAGHTYTLRVAAGGRASTRVPGLRAGRYLLRPLGGGPGATLIVGGQVGP